MEDEESDDEENSTTRNGRGRLSQSPVRHLSFVVFRCGTSYKWIRFSSRRKSYHCNHQRSQYEEKTRGTTLFLIDLGGESFDWFTTWYSLLSSCTLCSLSCFRLSKTNWALFKTRTRLLITIVCTNKMLPQVETNTKHWKWSDRATRKSVSTNLSLCKNPFEKKNFFFVTFSFRSFFFFFFYSYHHLNDHSITFFFPLSLCVRVFGLLLIFRSFPLPVLLNFQQRTRTIIFFLIVIVPKPKSP